MTALLVVRRTITKVAVVLPSIRAKEKIHLLLTMTWYLVARQIFRYLSIVMKVIPSMDSPDRIKPMRTVTFQTQQVNSASTSSVTKALSTYEARGRFNIPVRKSVRDMNKRPL